MKLRNSGKSIYDKCYRIIYYVNNCFKLFSVSYILWDSLYITLLLIVLMFLQNQSYFDIDMKVFNLLC